MINAIKRIVTQVFDSMAPEPMSNMMTTPANEINRRARRRRQSAGILFPMA